MPDKPEINSFEDGMPEIDEHWWNSVLADESMFQLEDKPAVFKPSPRPEEITIDWDHMKDLFEKDEIITLSVQGFNKGGLLVSGTGVQGFVPISHLINAPINAVSDDDRNEFLQSYVGKLINVKIIECEPVNERIVFSERAAQAGEGKRKELFNSLKPGVVAMGTITNVTEFGAFVDLGGVEGLIHVSEISWGRVEKPTDILEVGAQVRVLVLQISPETSRIALSIKRLTENPWVMLGEKYQAGDTVDAVITSVMKFGMFARLDEGVEGLIHISSLPEEFQVKDLKTVFIISQKIKATILHIDIERRRLGLGLVTEP